MNNQFATNVLIVILVVVFGMLLFNHFPVLEGEDSIDKENSWMPEEIVAGFIYEDGLHEYTGSIDFPNGCYSLDVAEALVMESYPEQVVLIFEATEPSPEDICAQYIKTEDFRILFGASDEATVSATYNGEPVDLLIIQSEALDSVEVLDPNSSDSEEEINPVEEPVLQ